MPGLARARAEERAVGLDVWAGRRCSARSAATVHPMSDLLVRVEPSEAVLARHPHPAPVLAAYERARAAGFARGADADDYIAAHLLAREVVGELIGAVAGTVALEQVCGCCGGNGHGRPAVRGSGVAVSWSHTRGVVAAAAARARAVGVDVERPRGQAPDAAVLEAAVTPGEAREVLAASDPEAAFLVLWTRKEALVKAGALTLDDVAQRTAIAAPGNSLTSWFDEATGAWVAASVVG